MAYLQREEIVETEIISSDTIKEYFSKLSSSKYLRSSKFRSAPQTNTKQTIFETLDFLDENNISIVYRTTFINSAVYKKEILLVDNTKKCNVNDLDCNVLGSFGISGKNYGIDFLSNEKTKNNTSPNYLQIADMSISIESTPLIRKGKEISLKGMQLARIMVGTLLKLILIERPNLDRRVSFLYIDTNASGGFWSSMGMKINLTNSKTRNGYEKKISFLQAYKWAFKGELPHNSLKRSANRSSNRSSNRSAKRSNRKHHP